MSSTVDTARRRHMINAAACMLVERQSDWFDSADASYMAASHRQAHRDLWIHVYRHAYIIPLPTAQCISANPSVGDRGSSM